MDRRLALKWMGFSLAAAAMAGIAPLTHSAIIKDRQRGKRRLVFYFTATGNSLFVARQFSDTPLSIPQELKKKDLAYEADEIAFVCPDYAGAIPDWSSLYLEQSQGRRFRRAGLLQCFFLCVDRELWIRFQEKCKIHGKLQQPIELSHRGGFDIIHDVDVGFHGRIIAMLNNNNCGSFLLSLRLVKQVVLILSFLLSLFSGGRTEVVCGGSSQDVLYAVTEDQSHENTAGYAQNKELCITAAQGYSFSGDSNPNSVSIRVTQSGKRTQSQVRSTFRIIKGGKVIDNNHSHPFLAESIAHQAGMYVPQRYLFSICRLRL